MGKKPDCRYWPNRGAWTDENGTRRKGGYFCWWEGTQRQLAAGPDDRPDGPTYRAAMRVYLGLHENRNALTAPDENRLGLVLTRYLEHVGTRRAPATVRMRRFLFAPFVAALGEVRAAELRPALVYDFLDAQRARRESGKPRGKPAGWSSSTVRTFIQGLNAALSWGVRAGYLTRNPLPGLESPPLRSRGRETLLSPDQRSLIRQLAAADQGTHFLDLVICLEETGARPGELLGATASAWDERRSALVYFPETTRRANEFAHKSRASKERVILFTGEALAVIRKLLARHPSGPLFRTRTGRAWRANYLNQLFVKMRRAVGHPGLVPYSFRHTFATDWLSAGRSVDQLAALLGNTPDVIRAHYSHLLGRVDALRDDLTSFRAGQRQGETFRVVG